MKKIIYLTIILSSLTGLSLSEDRVYVTCHDKPFMSCEEAEMIAIKADVAIIDVENSVNNPEIIRLIKIIKPKMKIIARINLTGTKFPIGAFRPIQGELLRRAQQLGESIWLKDSAGRPVVDPREGGAYVFNVSADDSLRQNKEYIALAAEIYSSQVSSTPIWDGFCVESDWNMIPRKVGESYYMEKVRKGSGSFFVDADQNGVNDTPLQFLKGWKNGIDQFISLMKEREATYFVLVY